MYKFIQKEQVNQNIDLPVFVFNGQKLLPEICGLLLARGVTTDEGARVYFDPDAGDLSAPAGLKNIADASKRIKAAIENGETILIFGDYDADGICAAAILYKYLLSSGAAVTAYIPDRADGYGLSVPVIERLAEEYDPDLWITCDCGISNALEAEYILDLGMDIIVTDHHELPETLPVCLTVNPKLPGQEYKYPSLCGAGVALMLVWAMGGSHAAAQYFGLCAVATIGDMVPLTGENRILTILGIKQLNAQPPLWLKKLAGFAAVSFPLTAQDIAYKIVPKINAAGRMGRAADAFELITSDDPAAIATLSAAIEDASEKRKAASEAMYNEALADLKQEKLYDRYAIVLSSPEWEKGIMGITAAQLSGNFGRPVFLMSKASEKIYKGTARSIPGLNIREVLAAAGDTLIEYGGHFQAAGFSLKAEDIPAFKQRVLSYVKTRAQEGFFQYRQDYDAETTEGAITKELARQLRLFEPFGTENRMPLFKIKLKNAAVTPMKNKPEHISVAVGQGAGMMCFNGHRLTDIFKSCAEKELLVEIRLNTYMGREETSVIIKHSSCPVFYEDIGNERILAEYIKQNAEALSKKSAGANAAAPEIYAPGGLEAVMEGMIDNPYGLIVAAHSYSSYKKFAEKYDPCGENFLHEYIYPSSPNNYNRLIIAPDLKEFDLSFYHTLIFLDRPLTPGVASGTASCGAKIYIPQAGLSDIGAMLKASLDLSRGTFGRYYSLFKALENTPSRDVYALYDKAASVSGDINLPQFVVCLYVFAQLNLLEYAENAPLKLPPGKADLNNSPLYKTLTELLM